MAHPDRSKLLSLREAVRQLRMLHAAFLHPDGGPEFCGLYLQSHVEYEGHVDQHRRWQVQTVSWCGYKDAGPFGRELVGGSDFDAVAAARRLLAAARDAGFVQ